MSNSPMQNAIDHHLFLKLSEVGLSQLGADFISGAVRGPTALDIEHDGKAYIFVGQVLELIERRVSARVANNEQANQATYCTELGVHLMVEIQCVTKGSSRLPDALSTYVWMDSDQELSVEWTVVRHV